MSNFSLTSKAKSDLKIIAVFTYKRWGMQKRNEYLLELDTCFHQLADNPNTGSTCDEIIQGYRKFPQGRHMIFYKETINKQIQIIRILHQNMDVTSHVEETIK